jgi:hypothetical protein
MLIRICSHTCSHEDAQNSTQARIRAHIRTHIRAHARIRAHGHLHMRPARISNSRMHKACAGTCGGTCAGTVDEYAYTYSYSHSSVYSYFRLCFVRTRIYILMCMRRCMFSDIHFCLSALLPGFIHVCVLIMCAPSAAHASMHACPLREHLTLSKQHNCAERPTSSPTPN